MRFFYVELFKNPEKIIQKFKNILEKKLTKCQNFFWVVFNILFIGSFTIFQTIELFRAENVEILSEILAFQLVCVGTCIKAVNIFFRKQQILSLLQTLEEIKKESWIKKTGGKNIERRINQTGIVYNFLFCSITFSCFFCFIDPYMFKALTYKMWFPLDYENNAVVWWSLYVYQLINCFVYMPLLNVLNMFPIFLIGYAIGLTEELCEKLEATTIVTRRKKQKNAGSSRQLETIHEIKDCSLEELLTCIKVQLKIKDFVSEITHSFAKIFWLHGFLSTVILCTTSFGLTGVKIFFIEKLVETSRKYFSTFNFINIAIKNLTG